MVLWARARRMGHGGRAGGGALAQVAQLEEACGGVFLRDQRRYAAGRRVHHARKSSRAEKHHPTTTWRSKRVRGESPTADPASTRTDLESGQASSASGDLALLAGVASSPVCFPSGLEAPAPPPPGVPPPPPPGKKKGSGSGHRVRYITLFALGNPN